MILQSYCVIILFYDTIVTLERPALEVPKLQNLGPMIFRDNGKRTEFAE